MSPKIPVRSKKHSVKDPTHMALMVDSLSQEEISAFDPDKVKEALINEDIPEQEAHDISVEVEEKLRSFVLTYNVKSVDTSFIRSFVNLVLAEKGHSEQLRSRKEFVISHDDITQIIESSNNENGNTEHNPESINLTLAGLALKNYSFKNIFSKDVVQAHLEGKLHVHDADYPTRAYCSGNSPLYLLRSGIKNIPNIMSSSKPAGSAQTFARHLCSMTQFLTSQFAGAIGWENINGFFSPLCRNLDNAELKQLAQTLIYDLSQLAGAKGGQTSFTDFNVYITVPKHYRDVYAMFEGGKFGAWKDADKKELRFFESREKLDEHTSTFKDVNIPATYADFEEDSQRFLLAILEVIKEGDSTGLPFAFPKINMHVNEDTFTIDGKEENKSALAILEKACEASSKTGCPYFIFDRNAMSVSQCCRLSIQFSEDDKKLVKTPEELRFVGVQNVSINLPNCALQSKGNEEKFFKEIESRTKLAMKAHMQKVKYLEHLMSVKNSPLKFYNKGMDGKPYVNLKKGSYLIGLVGLNESVYNLTGKEMHESKEAYQKGIQTIIFMNKITKQLSEEFGVTVKLEETPAESTAARFALLDKRKYPNAFVKENDKGIYYSNSVHFAYDSNVDIIERLMKQSVFHQLVEAGSMIHLWVGDHMPSPKAIFDLVKKTWYETKCAQWVLSPEYTVCADCEKTFVGFFNKCPKCDGSNVDNVTRVTGYYIKTSKANKGKKAEIQDRNHDTYILEK